MLVSDNTRNPINFAPGALVPERIAIPGLEGSVGPFISSISETKISEPRTTANDVIHQNIQMKSLLHFGATPGKSPLWGLVSPTLEIWGVRVIPFYSARNF